MSVGAGLLHAFCACFCFGVELWRALILAIHSNILRSEAGEQRAELLMDLRDVHAPGVTGQGVKAVASLCWPGEFSMLGQPKSRSP